MIATTPKSVFALAMEAGAQPFDLPQGYPDVEQAAQSLLKGRNPYFNEEYRQRFNIKVHTIVSSPQRLVLGCVESAAPHPGDTDRRYRCVMFRCDGNVMYQTPDNRKLDQHGAEVDMRYHMHVLVETDVLKALCLTIMKKANTLYDHAQRVYNILIALKGAP